MVDNETVSWSELQQMFDDVAEEAFDPETGEVLPSAVAPKVGETPFAAWLAQQMKRDDWIGRLAKGLKALPGYPSRGSADDVRALLMRSRASGDDFEAVDDAEREWLAA